MTVPAPLTLTDDRLLLRLPQDSDVPEITAACQDATLARWVPVPVPYDTGHGRLRRQPAGGLGRRGAPAR